MKKSEPIPLVREPQTLAQNVRIRRQLRGWSIRDLSELTGVSPKTILKVEGGGGCSIRTEIRIARGFGVYVGRLWESELTVNDPHRFISSDEGKWCFVNLNEAQKFYDRTIKTGSAPNSERLRSDPDQIQNPEERLRLGMAGLSTGFLQIKGGGVTSGIFSYNLGELYGYDCSPADNRGHTYLCSCLRGSIDFGIGEKVYAMQEGDSIVFVDSEPYWMKAIRIPSSLPSLFQFACLGVLAQHPKNLR